MKVVLELQDQRSNIKRVTVRHDIVIGRATECNLRVSSPQVSRRHCFLRISSSGVSITDLESANGTWLNGEKIVAGKRYRIEDGTDLNVGPVRFVARVSNEVPTVSLHGDEPAQAIKATVPPNPASSASMVFSIEHGGPSAEDDEPTVDYGTGYVPAAGLSGESAPDEFGDVLEVEALDFVDDSNQFVEAIVVDPEDITDFAAADDVEPIRDIPVIDEIIECDDVEIIDDVEVIDEIEVIDEREPGMNFAELDPNASQPMPSPDCAADPGVSWYPTDSDVKQSHDAELQKFLNGQ